MLAFSGCGLHRVGGVASCGIRRDFRCTRCRHARDPQACRRWELVPRNGGCARGRRGWMTLRRPAGSVPLVKDVIGDRGTARRFDLFRVRIAAHAYRQLKGSDIDVAVLVGPSHFVEFEGVAIYEAGGFETPLGVAAVDEECASAMMAATPVVRGKVSAHAREHSLEMQLPFLQRVAPTARIVPLVMGFQTPNTVRALGDALGAALRGRRAILVASTDLSHYHDAATASAPRRGGDRLRVASGCGLPAARARPVSGARLRRWADGGRHARGAPPRRARRVDLEVRRFG